MIRGLYFVFIFLFAVASYAQQSCTQRLVRAEDLYNAGRLLEVPSLIESCLQDENSFTEGEKIRARKLLTKVYIFTDNEAAAEEQFVALLNVDPVHQLQNEDPSELRVLMAKFRTWPVFRIEVKGGLNMTMIGVDQEFSAFPASLDSKAYGQPLALGWQIGADITKYWKKGIEFGAGFQYRASKYTVVSEPGGDVFTTEIENSQTTLRLPIFVRYNFNYDAMNRLTPYVFVGTSFDYLLKAEYSDASRTGGTSYSIDSEFSDLKSFGQVNEINGSFFGGAGVKLRVKKGNFFSLEVRYDKGMALYNIPEERYANPAVNGDLQYVEDDLFLNMMSVNFGYIRSIFKPEKLDNK